MRQGKRSLLLLWGFILLASATVGQAASNSVILSGGGYNGFGSPVPGFLASSPSGANNGGSTAATLPSTVFSVSGSGPNSGGTTSAWSQNITAGGETDYTQLHASLSAKTEAISSDSSSSPSIFGSLVESSSQKATLVQAGNPSGNGFDTVTASWKITGGFTSDDTPDSGVMPGFNNYATATAAVTFTGTGIPVNLNTTATLNLTNSGATTTDLPQVIPISFLVQLNTPFVINNRLQITVQAQSQVSGPTSDSNGMTIQDPITDEEASLSAAFGNSILWGGITSVTDSNGNPVTDYTLLGETGTNYNLPAVDDVPEPAPLALAALTLTALLRHRPRRAPAI